MTHVVFRQNVVPGVCNPRLFAEILRSFTFYQHVIGFLLLRVLFLLLYSHFLFWVTK